MSERKHLDFLKNNIGEITDVLFEGAKSDGLVTGFTANYIRVEYPWHSKLPGQIKNVRLTGVSPTGRMTAELID